MPELIVTTGSASFFGVLVAFYLYFMPAIMAFMRAHPHFRAILALNLAVAPVQITVCEFFGIFPHAGMGAAQLSLLALLMVLGPGWLLLLVWALRPAGAPDDRLVAWRRTKTYDMAAALPLIAWLLGSVLTMQPDLSFLGKLILAGEADSLMLLQFASLTVSALFCVACVWLLLIRDTPILRAQGVLPRLAALTAIILPAGMLRLPVPEMSLVLQAVVFLLTGVGGAAAIAVLWRLGKSFSIVPEARVLVTRGVYAHVRHPLYAAQIVTLLGMTLQYRQPWALLMGSAAVAVQVIRSLYEERVLMQAFPDYESYRARTKRFIPGVI